MEGLKEYLSFHQASSFARDIDPQNDCLTYICDRYELNIEQRYWLAFLFATCYCAPTVFYIYNEFPDYQNVDVGRLERWWTANRNKLVFQTDRARVRSNNEFVNCFKSYREIIGTSQQAYFQKLSASTPQDTYVAAYKRLTNIHYFGRFTMFIYLELVSVLTDVQMIPNDLNLREAESCRNGLALALGRKDLFSHFEDKTLTVKDYSDLEHGLELLTVKISDMNIKHKNLFNIETTLCAYKKVKLGKRFVGYYIERMRSEIEAMKKNVPVGVDWSVLYDFRKATYQPKYLKEANAKS
jgi:hypothetical protein